MLVSKPIAAVMLPILAFLTGCGSTRTLDRMSTPAEHFATSNTLYYGERVGYGAITKEKLAKRSPYLKAHMLDGRVCVLADWRFESGGGIVRGTGSMLSFNRDTLATGDLFVPVDSVAIFETNIVRVSGPAAMMTLITGLSIAITAACAMNPKACFGSCPTFYVSDGDSLLLQAEGFSSSIAPSLEASDIDALYKVRPTERSMEIEMRNEAFETHVVRYTHLLLAPRPPNGRVLAGPDGEFRQTREFHTPLSCRAPEGDCLDAIRDFDGVERFSPADSSDLSAKEEIEILFEVPAAQPVGLAIAARKTLLTTFLFYQTLAYMGEDVGTWFALIERFGSGLGGGRSLWHALGGIDVLMKDSSGAWSKIGALTEFGPLATDLHMVPLPEARGDTVRVRLRMTKGNWRIDYVAVAELGAPVEPIRLAPSAVFRDSTLDEPALALLSDSPDPLTTLPGDIYTLRFDLPGDPESYEFFLESRGYYLEWLREEWMAERDPARVRQILFSPGEVLRDLAPRFKAIEPEMESSFWNSRYARQ